MGNSHSGPKTPLSLADLEQLYNTHRQEMRDWEKKLGDEILLRKGLERELKEAKETMDREREKRDREVADAQRLQIEQKVKRLEVKLRAIEKEKKIRNSEAKGQSGRKERRRELERELRKQETKQAEEREILVQRLERLEKEREEWGKDRRNLEKLLREAEAKAEEERCQRWKDKLDEIEQRQKVFRKTDPSGVGVPTLIVKEHETSQQLAVHETASEAFDAKERGEAEWEKGEESEKGSLDEGKQEQESLEGELE